MTNSSQQCSTRCDGPSWQMTTDLQTKMAFTEQESKPTPTPFLLMKMGMKSSSEAVTGSNSDPLDGLKFGKKVYFGSGCSSSSMPPPPPPPAKKGKMVGPAKCQVEGCSADLAGVKAYYCKHKVCGMHSKSPKVVVAGIEQRFCQQCSRFHRLDEFDQGKRSCRRRLAGHNERRRKPPPSRLSSSFHDDSGRFRSFLMDFSIPKPSVTSRDMWPTVRASNSNQWQASFDVPRVAPMAQPYVQAASQFTAHELPLNECAGGITDSSCALSLLSSQPGGGTVGPRHRGPTGQRMTVLSGYVGHGTGMGNSSHEIEHDMGFGQFGSGNDRFSGELELALQGNRHCPHHMSARSCYEHSGGVMHWSL